MKRQPAMTDSAELPLLRFIPFRRADIVEMCLGDGAYRGCLHCIAKFPLNFNQLWDPLRRRFVHFDLNEAQQEANRIISKPRQRIEHAVYLCSSKHRLFRVAYQGYYPELVGAVHISVHFANAQHKMASVNGTAGNGFSRYRDTVGPWRHDGT